jgi:hypothetical protein
MRKTYIEVSHTIKEDDVKNTFRYHLTEPWLPDGCEECGALKGSPFEIRLMRLIRFYAQGGSDPFLCKRCFVKASAQEHERLATEYNRRHAS